MLRRLVTLLPVLACVLLGGAVLHQDERRPVAIVATPIVLDRDDPNLRRIGVVTLLGAWRLTSDDIRFGGLSSMEVDGRGGFVAVSDTGELFRFRMGVGGKLRDTDVVGQPGGGEWVPKATIDTESIARDPASGTVWLGLESINEIRRLDPAFGTITARVRPAAMRRWPEATGAETLARLRDGRFLVVAENAPRKGGGTVGLLFPGDPMAPGAEPLRFGYRPPAGFRPTDARQLPDGRVVVLNRRASLRHGLAAALTILDPAAIRAGAIVPSHEIARLAWPLGIDNMESLAVTQERGRTILWIASDDNYMWFQRTLLLKLRLDGDAR